MAKETVLISGGAGYIGSHTAVELIAAGYDAVIIDNLSNSEAEAVEGVRRITGVDVPSSGSTPATKRRCDVSSKNTISAPSSISPPTRLSASRSPNRSNITATTSRRS